MYKTTLWISEADLPRVPGWETATVKYTQFEMRVGLRVEIVYLRDKGLEWVRRAAHRAASLQGIVSRLAADTEIVVLILSSL